MSELALQRIENNKRTKEIFLDLSNCGLIEVPEEIGDLVWLEELTFFDHWGKKQEENESIVNHIQSIVGIEKLTHLKSLNVSKRHTLSDAFDENWKLNDLSPLSELKKLQRLHCYNTQVSDLSPLSGMNMLQELQCSGTQIFDLSPLLALDKLQILNFSATEVNQLEPISNLKSLRSLSLSCCTKIRDFQPLQGLVNLRYLDLSSTNIDDLKPLSGLTQLEELYISGIPKSGTRSFGSKKYSGELIVPIFDLQPLSKLTKLQVLGIGYTLVNDLSPILFLINEESNIKWEWMRRAEKSKKGISLYVENCPFTTPPTEVVRQGGSAILRYFEQLEKEGTDRIFEAKLLLIGEGGAGKTSLCRKLFDPKAELPKEKDSTQGIDIQPLYFNMPDGKQFRLNVWDFAGQGKYQSAHSFFYTHRSLYILVDDTRTLDENEAYRTFYHHWLQTAELFGGDSPLLVLHNQKADRARTGFNLGSFQAIFPFVKELFCINLGGGDTEGILDLKKQIERWAQKLPHIGDVVPKTWVKVREDIEKERQQRPYISDERYREICATHGIKDELKQSDLSHYFHDLGVFLHFQENSLLRRDVFLQNEWVTNAVYKILDDPEIAVKKRGRFDKSDLARLWNEGFYAKRRDELLALMLQFELCYQVQDTEIYVAPQLLPGDIPKYDLGKDIPLQLKYEYGFMPKGLLYRLIVRLHRHIAQGQSAVWNSGVVLERTGAQADILESLDRRQIAVRATGARAKELVTIIAEEVERLHDTYGERLKVETKIPCNCRICKDSQTPHFYDKRDLDNRLMKGKATVECRVSFDDVNVQGLLDGVFTQVVDIDRVTLSHPVNTTLIRELIEEGETRKALEILKKINPNEATVLLGKLAELNKKYPTLTGEEYLREKSKIDAGLLALLDF